MEFRNGQLNISSKGTTSSYKGDTCKVWFSSFDGGQETALTVKIPGYAQTAIQSTLRAEGVIDLSYPGSTNKITPSYKNYALVGNEEFCYSITAKGAKGTPPDANRTY